MTLAILNFIEFIICHLNEEEELVKDLKSVFAKHRDQNAKP